MVGSSGESLGWARANSMGAVEVTSWWWWSAHFGLSIAQVPSFKWEGVILLGRELPSPSWAHFCNLYIYRYIRLEVRWRLLARDAKFLYIGNVFLDTHTHTHIYIHLFCDMCMDDGPIFMMYVFDVDACECIYILMVFHIWNVKMYIYLIL